MTKAVIYARVSTEDQASEGKVSISTQLDDCRELAAKLGWNIVGEYVDDRQYRSGKRLVQPSGKNADRPQWRRMLAELSAGRADAVLAWSTSRLYRGYKPMAEFLEILETRPIQVQLAKEQFSQEFAIFPAWLAKKDNSDRVDRMMMGKAGVARKGFHPSRHTPFYKTIRNEDGRRIGCEFRPEYRAFFDRLAELFLDRISYPDMALRLGVNPVNGKPLSNQSVRQIMRNPWYRGLLEHGRRAGKTSTQHFIVQGVQPAAWDAATCARIEVELARRETIGLRVSHGRGGGLFSGVARCGYCGRVLSAYHSGKYVNYACAMAYKWRPGWPPQHGLPHPGNNVSERKLLLLLQELMQALEDGEAEAYLPATQRSAPRVPAEELARVRLALAELQAELDALPPSARRSRALLADEIESTREVLAGLETETEQAQAVPFDFDDMRRRAARLRQSLESQDSLQEQRDELRATFPYLYVKSGEFSLPPTD